MTDRPYTETDLRAEAAICLLALSIPPTTGDILRALPGAYIESRCNNDRSGDTWGDLLDNTSLAEVARTIHDRLALAADLSAWAVNLGADGLQPASLNLWMGPENTPRVRVHFAFAPDMPEDDRARFIEQIAAVMTTAH